MKHTKGPFIVKPFDESQAVLIPNAKDGRQPLVAIISIGYDRPDSEGNSALLPWWDTAPHFCSDPECPGEINRRKLEAAEEIVKAIQVHIIEFDKLLSPHIWRAIPAVERGHRMAELIQNLEAALSCWQKAGKGEG